MRHTLRVAWSAAAIAAIAAAAASEGLFILDDAAQAFGATFNNRRLGSFGHATATSFFPAKPLGCYGDGGAVSAKRIAEEFHIPPERLAKILQRLAKKKLVASHNGPKGGYVLTRDPAEITVGQVVRT